MLCSYCTVKVDFSRCKLGKLYDDQGNSKQILLFHCKSKWQTVSIAWNILKSSWEEEWTFQVQVLLFSQNVNYLCTVSFEIFYKARPGKEFWEHGAPKPTNLRKALAFNLSKWWKKNDIVNTNNMGRRLLLLSCCVESEPENIANLEAFEQVLTGTCRTEDIIKDLHFVNS